MTTWAARLLTFLGSTHLVLGTIFGWRFFGDWLRWRLLFEDSPLTVPPPMVGAFFFGPASFGLPLLLIGLLIGWLGKQRLAPPRFLGWGLLAWSVTCAIICPPAPWLLATIAAVLLLMAARRTGAITPDSEPAGSNAPA